MVMTMLAIVDFHFLITKFSTNRLRFTHSANYPFEITNGFVTLKINKLIIILFKNTLFFFL